MIRNSTLLAALALTFLSTAPASAATVANTPLFAGYWSDFLDHWLGALRQQNGIVLFVVGIGAVSLFIITRGKWKK